MRLISVIKYNLYEKTKSAVIFLGVMVAILLLLVMESNTGGGQSRISGFEMASIIFLFIVGLNSFKNSYLYLSTNGITRRDQFFGFQISAVIIAVVMSTFGLVYGFVSDAVTNYQSIFEQIYRNYSGNYVFTSFIWSSAIYLFAIAIGYFITTLYYRMSKILKVVVSVSVPAILFIGIPIIDTRNIIYHKIFKIIEIFFGLNGGVKPFSSAIYLTAGAVVLAGLSYLLVRRATVKD